jgi:ribulose-5-phosphate 4-epimerase/fuculose-1-phosphate aldolase
MRDPFEQLCDALYWLAAKKDVVKDTHGNLSLRVDKRQILIKPSGMAYDEITVDDLVLVDLNTKNYTCPNKRKPSVDLPHHISIYEKYPDITGICHTHSPHVVAHASWHLDIDVFCTEAADYFGTRIACLSYEGLDDWGRAVNLKSGAKAVLLGMHGGLTFGRAGDYGGALEAAKLAAALENLAEKHSIAWAMFQRRPPTLPAEDIAAWHTRYWTSYGQ